MSRKNRNNKQREDSVRMDAYIDYAQNVNTDFSSRSPISNISGYNLLDAKTLQEIYAADGLGRRIVDVLAEEVFRSGFHLDGVTAATQDQLSSVWESLNLEVQCTNALAWSRLFGGAVVVAVYDDGKTFEDELIPGTGVLKGVRVYDRYQCKRDVIQDDIQSPEFGKVEWWEISDPENPSGLSYYVHDSRVFCLDGERIPNAQRKANEGWGASCLQGVTDALRDFGLSHGYVTSLLARKQQGVWKALGLASLCADDFGMKAVRRRLSLVDRSRGNNNSIGIDAEKEEYSLLNGDINGVTDVLSKKMTVITAVTGIHESILTGQNVSGLNSGENVALESFHKLTARLQKTKGRPLVMFLVSLIIDDPTWTVEFEPLSIPSEKDAATANKTQADADNVYFAYMEDDEIRKTIRARNGDYQLIHSDKISVDEPEEDDNGNQEDQD